MNVKRSEAKKKYWAEHSQKRMVFRALMSERMTKYWAAMPSEARKAKGKALNGAFIASMNRRRSEAKKAKP